MSHRLAEGQPIVLRAAQVRAELEHGLERRAFAVLGHHASQFLELAAVVRAQLTDAHAQTPERALVRRQHERIVGAGLESVERLEPQRERIALGLGGVDHRVGRDAGQQLVAADQQPRFRAVEADVLGRMTFADDDAPATRADGEHVAAA